MLVGSLMLSLLLLLLLEPAAASNSTTVRCPCRNGKGKGDCTPTSDREACLSCDDGFQLKDDKCTSGVDEVALYMTFTAIGLFVLIVALGLTCRYFLRSPQPDAKVQIDADVPDTEKVRQYSVQSVTSDNEDQI